MAKINEVDNTAKVVSKVVVWVIGLVVILIVVFGTFYTIQPGERGVLITLGKPSMDAMNEGFHMKVPLIQKIVKMEVRTQKYEAGATAASQDLQIVTATIATNYHILPETVPKIYTELGLAYGERVIQPMEQEVVKATTAKFTAAELITKREEVRMEMKTLLTERLRERGIIVEEVSIVNFDFSKSFNEAIEAKVTAEQLKLKAENDLQRIKVEAEQTITQANATATSRLAIATAEAQSLRLQRQEITPQLIQLRSIEKWNGVLPSVTGGVVPFINVQSTQS
jgi:regulator of protease activity HflC (stomatin/prohibitin superfamily)